MSVFGGIVLFAAGIAVGGGAVKFNRWCVESQTSQLRRENEHLRTSVWQDRLEYETDRAWRKGYREGRKSPMSDVERLADTLEKRKIDFRTVREGPRHGQAAKR